MAVCKGWWEIEILPKTLCECRTDSLLCEDFLQDWKKELFTETFGGIFDSPQNHVMLDGWSVSNEQ